MPQWLAAMRCVYCLPVLSSSRGCGVPLCSGKLRGWVGREAPGSAPLPQGVPVAPAALLLVWGTPAGRASPREQQAVVPPPGCTLMGWLGAGTRAAHLCDR